MELLSKEYVNELGRLYFPTNEYSVQPYHEKFGWAIAGQSTRFNTSSEPTVFQGNWVDCYGVIIRVASAIVGNFNIANTGDFGRKLKALFPTTQNTFDSSYFRIFPPGYSNNNAGVQGIYYLVPSGTVIPSGVTINEQRAGRYVINVRTDGTLPSTILPCSVVDSCLYVGYLTTSNTVAGDTVINTYEFDYLGYYPDIIRSRGYVLKSNFVNLSETTSDNIHVFNTMSLISQGSKSISFTGYRIVPSYSDLGTPTFTIQGT